jgi:chemotaxis response regulator CheB
MRKQVKRKVWALINPIQHAVIGASITQRDKLDKLRVMEYSALDAITKGRGTIQDWHTLTEVLNLSETMARAGVGPEVLPVCENAQKALHEAALRYQKTMTIGLTGEGIQAVRELIAFADLQQSSISRSEFERYIQKTRDYIKSNNNNVVEII